MNLISTLVYPLISLLVGFKFNSPHSTVGVVASLMLIKKTLFLKLQDLSVVFCICTGS